jgi:hypothetical protein
LYEETVEAPAAVLSAATSIISTVIYDVVVPASFLAGAALGVSGTVSTIGPSSLVSLYSPYPIEFYALIFRDM